MAIIDALKIAGPVGPMQVQQIGSAYFVGSYPWRQIGSQYWVGPWEVS